MQCFTSVLFYALVCETTHVYSVDYCQLNCVDGKHTVCLYPKVQPSENCKGYKEKLISESDKHLIVDLHNNFRNKVAEGEELTGSPGPQPAAADMMEVDWDDEIAFIAQQWAYQCKFAHDACRRVKDSSVGQNLAIEINTDKFHHDFSSAIKGWYDEVKDMPASIVDEFKTTEGPAIGHYTQMINAKSVYVGCGHVFYEAEGADQYASQLACNYKPAGNTLGAPIYKKGKPCSQCPSGTKCSKTWKNLCSTGKRRYGKGAADKYYPRPNLVVVLLLLVLGPSNCI